MIQIKETEEILSIIKWNGYATVLQVIYDTPRGDIIMVENRVTDKEHLLSYSNEDLVPSEIPTKIYEAIDNYFCMVGKNDLKIKTSYYTTNDERKRSIQFFTHYVTEKESPEIKYNFFLTVNKKSKYIKDNTEISDLFDAIRDNGLNGIAIILDNKTLEIPKMYRSLYIFAEGEETSE